MAINNNGSLSFELQLKMAQFKEDAKRASQELSKLGKTAEDEGKRIDNSFSNIGRTLSSLGAVVGAQQLVKEIVRVRGEFQKLDVAFTTMLGSQEKATALMNQLVHTAATTPFGLQDVAGGAKQLLAYGMEAEKINETLIRLGDIAAGLSIPLGDMTYLFGTTMVQGRMYTQDLNQFVGRGIPLIKEFAEQFGVAESKVKDLVTEGKIGFPELEKAIIAMTSEGGQFAGLMEAQSKTIAGQIANLEDAIDMMFNEIGQASQGIITEAIGVASTLVENYEKVGKVLLSLVGVFGVYKTAVIAVTAIQAAQAAAVGGLSKIMMVYEGVVQLVTKAQKILNATMLTNPYVLVATAVAGLVAYLVMMKDETELIAEAEAEYNAKLEETARVEEERKKRVQELIKVAEDESKSTESRKASLAKLEKQYPTIFEKYDTEYEKLKNLKQIKLEIAEIEISNDIKEIDKQLEDNQKRIKDLNEKSEVKTNIGGGLRSTVVVTGGLSRTEDAELKMLKNKNTELEKNRELKKQELDDLKNPKKTTTPTTTTTTTTNKKAEDQAKKEAERKLKLQQQLADELLEQQQANEQARIDAMKEGSKKRLRQIDQDYKTQMAEINKQAEEWRKKNAEAGVVTDASGLTEEQSTAIASARAQADQKRRNDTKQVRADEKRSMNEYLAEYGSLQEQKLALAELYAEKIANAVNDGEKKALQAQYRDAVSAIDIEINKSVSVISKAFGDMSDKTSKELRMIATEAEYAYNFLKKGEWDDIQGMLFGMSKDTFDSLRLNNQQMEELANIIKRLRNDADDAAVGFDKIKQGLDKLKDAGNDVEKLREAIQILKTGFDDYGNAIGFVGDSLGKLGDAFGNDTLSDISEGISGVLGAMDSAFKGAEAGTIFGPIGMAAGAALGFVSSLAQSIGQLFDKKHERKIKALQGQIDDLGRAYDRLGDTLDNVYSRDAAAILKEQNVNLAKQKALIQQQIKEEEAKWKTDKDKIKAWRDELADIDAQMQENRIAAVDAIFGQDVNTAIENFADAWGSAWSEGTSKVKAAKDMVRDMMKAMVNESVKATIESSDAMEKIRTKLQQFYADNVLTVAEQDTIIKMAEDLQRELDAQYGWAENLYRDTYSQEGSSRGFESMSQDTASELNGRFATMVEIQAKQLNKSAEISIDTSAIRQTMLLTATNVEEIRNMSLLSIGHLERIAKNTNELYGINNRLAKIEEYTSRL